MKVYQAINKIQAELAKEGISKERENNTQGQGYKFRGIDDVYNALCPLLAKHGLCILPRVLSRLPVERQSKSGGALFYITLEVEFDFVASEDGSKHIVKMFGEAMDSGDKATNKAMSAAYKYACFQTFCIPVDAEAEGDAVTHQVKPNTPSMIGKENFDSMDTDQQKFIGALVDQIRSVLDIDGPEAAMKLLESQRLEVEEKTAVWSFLDSKERSALKKAAKPAKEQDNGPAS